MKRLLKKSNIQGNFPFDEVRGLISQQTPNALFGLSLEEQEKLSSILDLFENAVKDAANFTGLGSPQLEVGVTDYNNLAYYSPGSNTLTLNENNFDQLFSAPGDYIEMVGVHEYGHYVDEKLGDVSQTQDWLDAVKSSQTNYLEGYGITATTDVPAEQFANAFVAYVWQATDDECTQFIDSLIRNK